MKHGIARLLVSLLAILSFTLLTGTFSPLKSLRSYATAQAASCEWHKVNSPSIGGVLWGVSAYSTSDVWAVGSSAGTAITEHWDGTHWSYVLSPQPGDYANDLSGIVALAPNNVWAVGYHQNYKGMYERPEKTLVEHWDGTQWKVIASPSPGSFYNALSAIVAVSPTDIWAVGSQGPLNGISTTLVEHWDGTSWSIVSSPNIGTYGNGLTAVTALSSSDIWAVGEYANHNYGGYTLIEHWNGTQWSIVSSPNVGNYENGLRSVAATAPNDIWAAGYNWVAPGDILDALIEHWNGKQWSIVTSPQPPGGDNALDGVAVVSSTNVWATGSSASGAITMQWNGQQWNIIANSGKQSQFLTRLAVINAQDMWAVGSTTTLMMVMHYC